MSVYQTRPVIGPLDAVAAVPGSKSLTNRALVLAALADGPSILSNILLAEDTWLMIEALGALGIPVTVNECDATAEVSGCRGQIPADEAQLYCGNSGTTIRFCTALCALARGGRFRLDGIARMRRRPIGPLVDALRRLGGAVEFHGDEGFPPLTVHASGLRGGEASMGSPESSQFVSALLMAAPYASSDVMLEVEGDLPSRPFVDMTLSMMERFGVTVLADKARFIVESSQRYGPVNLTIEPDATNAMYFLSAAALAGGRVTLPGLGTNSVQGDIRFSQVLASMGCNVAVDADRITVSRFADSALRGADVDFSAMPDMVPTLAVLALFADGPTTIRNVANLRLKESDRLAALARELSKLGARVEERSDGLRIDPPRTLRPAAIDTHNDHRMAMSFALAGLRCPGITINDPECCGKTFPDFFERFERLASR